MRKSMQQYAQKYATICAILFNNMRKCMQQYAQLFQLSSDSVLASTLPSYDLTYLAGLALSLVTVEED